jgi:prepilin-type N-terminal cleavage/methylation domain-containing protein
MKGFTLLETIIALAIMTMAFGAILATISDSINASARTHEMTIIEMLAKREIVETEYKFEGKTFDEYKKEDSGTFPAPYESYRWTAVVKEIEFPNIGGMNSGGSQGAASNTDNNNSEVADMMSKLVTQFLSKAVREVTVTILWMKGSKEQNFAVSTYWVDLNHEFQLTQ